MTQVVLHRSEVNGQHLPFVCLRCGQPASHWKSKRFLLASPGGAANVGLLTLIEVPLCDGHKNHWFWRGIFGWVIGAPLVAFFLSGLVAVAEPQEVSPAIRGPLTILFGIGFLGVLLWLPAMLVLHYNSVRAMKIGKDDITLLGVSPIFVNELKAYRRLGGRFEESE
jgi:hypothetical protein